MAGEDEGLDEAGEGEVFAEFGKGCFGVEGGAQEGKVVVLPVIEYLIIDEEELRGADEFGVYIEVAHEF